MKSVVVIVAAAALLAACGSSSQAPTGTAPLPTGNATKVSIVISDDGCAPEPASVGPGATEFDVSNSGSNTVGDAQVKTEDGKHILGELENVTPGVTGSFTLKLKAGKYKIVCAYAKQDAWDFTVKGATLTAATK